MTPGPAPLRVYLDEDVDVLLAAHGIDCLTTLAAGNRGRTDEEQLTFALRESRILITHNRSSVSRYERARKGSSMDRISKSLLDEFCQQHDLAHLAEEQQFEHFAAYLTISRYHAETFDTLDVVTGAGGDTGIDAVGIVVNGALVTDSEEVADLADRNRHLDVTFIFVQANRGAGFATAKIGQFGYGVMDFFNEKPTLPRNERIKDAAAIMGEVYDRSGKFVRGNPACRLYYVTTGKWIGDQQLEARRDAVVSDLTGLGIFRDVEFTPIGQDAIQELYRQTKNAISREFNFSDRTVMPEIPGVSEAYLGLLPASEFLTLIIDDKGDLIKSIFYDNVRDWQDYNVVNAGIRDTLASADLRPRFALMNNGITVIAKTLRATGNRFYIEDYQIVNGCQTSHVLYDQKNALDESVRVPVRIIATQDEEVIASTIKATNRQTQVDEEQLLALSDFQKKLEAYFETFGNGKRLYFERRSCQYNSVPGIEKTRIITRPNLIRAYAAMFLEEPHRTTRNYKALLAGVGKTIFADDHRLEPYYVAALALYRLEFLFRNSLLDAKYKPARYHTLLAFRYVASESLPPRSGSNEMERYCAPLIELLWDNTRAEQFFKRAASVVESVAKGNFDRDHIRTEPFTEALKAHCKKIRR